jgi:hypothetical protein
MIGSLLRSSRRAACQKWLTAAYGTTSGSRSLGDPVVPQLGLVVRARRGGADAHIVFDEYENNYQRIDN